MPRPYTFSPPPTHRNESQFWVRRCKPMLIYHLQKMNPPTFSIPTPFSSLPRCFSGCGEFFLVIPHILTLSSNYRALLTRCKSSLYPLFSASVSFIAAIVGAMSHVSNDLNVEILSLGYVTSPSVSCLQSYGGLLRPKKT